MTIEKGEIERIARQVDIVRNESYSAEVRTIEDISPVAADVKIQIERARWTWPAAFATLAVLAALGSVIWIAHGIFALAMATPDPTMRAVSAASAAAMFLPLGIGAVQALKALAPLAEKLISKL